MKSNKRQPEEQQLKAKKEIEKWQSLCKDYIKIGVDIKH